MYKGNPSIFEAIFGKTLKVEITKAIAKNDEVIGLITVLFELDNKSSDGLAVAITPASKNPTYRIFA